jgi:ferredoxin
VESIVERRIGELTIRIDRTLCVGFGDCMEVAPDVFEFDADGICAFRAECGEPEPDRLVEACDVCPVDALVALDAKGVQLAPRRGR